MGAFVIEGEFIAEQAREMVLSDMPAKAWRLLADSLMGKGAEEVARRVLEGTMTLAGDSESGVYTVEEDDPEYRKRLAYVYAGRWKSKHGWCRPVAEVIPCGIAPQRYARRHAKNPSVREWLRARADYYCGRHEFAVNVTVKRDGVREGTWAIFESCGEPPFWLKNRNRSAQAAVNDAFRVGRSLDRRGYQVSSISDFTKVMTKDQDLDKAEAERLRELAYAVEDELRAEQHRAIGERVREQAAGDTFPLTLLDGRVVDVPRAPFWCWALRRDEHLAHHAPEWKPVSPVGLKLQLDDPYHSDWMLGSGIELSESYDNNVKDPAWEEAGRIQDRLRHPEEYADPKPFAGIMAALESLRSETVKATVIVDAGLVSGVVGEDIAVLPDLSPLQVPAIEKAKAVIAATGGPASHLAIVARGQDLTVLRVPDACSVFEPGTSVELDPKRGVVRVLEVNS